MPQVKFRRAFDYRKGLGKMTSYEAGYEGNIPDAHYEAAVQAGAIADGDTTGKATRTTTGGTAGGDTGGSKK